MSSLKFQTDNAPHIRVEVAGGDVTVEGWDQHEIELDGELRTNQIRQEGNQFVLGPVAGDLELQVPNGATVVLYRVGGDVEVSNVATLEVASAGGDLEVSGVRQVRVDMIGGDAELDLTEGQATVGRVGGDLEVSNATQLTVGVVGGDAELAHIGSLRGLERVGGDLELDWNGALEGEMHLVVGGDLELTLGNDANFKLTAQVRGEVEGNGEGWEIEGERGTFTATFGEGTGTLNLRIGGDLEIDGGRTTDAKFEPSTDQREGREGREREGRGQWSFEGFDREFGRDMRGFGREMEAMARDLAQIGGQVKRDVMREFRRSFTTPEDEGRGRKRVRVVVGGKGFDIDPEQVERIRESAEAAAAAGIARAKEAVARAFSNMNIPTPPAPPAPPAPATPAMGVTPPTPPTPPSIHNHGTPPTPGSFTGNTIKIERGEDEPAPVSQPAQPKAAKGGTTEEDRLAILRMVASKLISPAEAEQMLRSLEQGA